MIEVLQGIKVYYFENSGVLGVIKLNFSRSQCDLSNYISRSHDFVQLYVKESWFCTKNTSSNFFFFKSKVAIFSYNIKYFYKVLNFLFLVTNMINGVKKFIKKVI